MICKMPFRFLAYLYHRTLNSGVQSASETLPSSYAVNEEEGKGDATCCVCLIENIRPVTMPCCTVSGSSISYCKRCIEIICQLGEGVGKCPTCTKAIQIDGLTGIVTNVFKKGKCRICNQPNKDITDFQRSLCARCVEGTGQPLEYECNRCHRTQVIPHPMYTYQTTPEEYSSATWACHRGCNDYTNWKIIDPQVITDRQAPESWGRRQHFLARVRTLRLEEMEP